MEEVTESKVVLYDPTLRDGHHAVRHQLDADQLRAYATAADQAGVPVVEVGHGNGLGASSHQLGQAKLSDDEMLTVVRESLTRSRMGVFLAPGWGTGADLAGAVARGADVVRIAAHCSQADVAERHLGEARAAGVEAQAVLLMSHMIGPAELAEQCALLISYGAQAVGIMDSAGHYLPTDVTTRITAVTRAVGEVPVIFHGHNNLGLAMANSLAAVTAGATVIDGCARGFGAGAGNAQLEVLAAVLQRTGHPTGIDLHQLLAAADIAEARLMSAPPTIDSISLVSGLAGVFSGFKLPVLEAARRGGVDPVDVLFELGRRQVVAGQEDQIPAVVRQLQRT
ncbi:4-hydroxy-2-oxovalerate aldolase [Kitasatospora sp. GP82]|uniref:4-hydroxy-2-oxovalerate aldolase n=1 Tax=Kitasatospora sp. GP82 TaxID=3035089 RepID=UPI002473E9E8|nr:4-hydroxy-2-oxovalerate aldolase [Kitasatospora sp. GP82]MDH6130253.1 4-hydroxy 2-oxovalerate aldolase [Kitasatospora sp. GP82]